MNKVNKWSLFISTALAVSFLLLKDANAARGRGVSLGGDMGLGLGISTVSAGQDDMNGAIDAASAAGASIKNLGSALEFYVNWTYRFDRSIYALVIRPSYFTQSVDGSGSGGNYNYKLNGYTVMPILRLYPLENDFIKFYMQAGLGYGSLSGSITAGAKNLDFSGSAFGAMGGVGVEFCFTPTHCVNVEGNLRYMPIERNLASGGNCSASGDIPGISQCANGSEVERNGNDLKTTLSGVQGLVGYIMNF